MSGDLIIFISLFAIPTLVAAWLLGGSDEQ